MGKLYSKCWKPPVKALQFDADFAMAYVSGPHLDTGQWLKKLDLKEYGSLFKNYSGVEDILSLTERELKLLGIKNGSHRARMMTSLVILKDKYDRAEKRIRSLSAQNSVRNIHLCSNESLNSGPRFRSHRFSLPEDGYLCTKSSRSADMEPLADTEASPEDLKKVLDWELSLDNNDLRSHAWYHGTIPRQRAEELMSEEGDFLIRDCISRPGDYVLTCRWKSTSLHFVINKVVFQPFTVYEKIQYQFEDDCFDTVPDLVTYYVGNKRPISAASGAIVSRPVNRSMPLSYYASRYGLECQMHYATLALEKADMTTDGKSSTPTTDDGRQRKLSTPSSGSPKLNDETHPSGASTMPRPSSTSDYPQKSAANFSTLRSRSLHHSGHQIYPSDTAGTRSESNNTSGGMQQDPKPSHTRSASGSSVEPPSSSSGSAEGESSDDAPPPKPSRVPSKRYGTTGVATPTQNSNSESVAESVPSSHLYSELNYPEKTTPTKQPIPESESADGSFGSKNDKESPPATDIPQKTVIPDLNPPSNFNLKNFTTLLLPTENKPLDPPALARMRCMLLEYGPRVIASHLTKMDLDILRVAGQCDLGLGVVTGFELLLLPQGQQMRLDLLERTECLKFFVAITILTCGDEDVRSQVLNKWIQIAVETKTALGNLYGFTGIMQGLVLPQISRLRSTWLKLRQTHTDNAFAYETKLRPILKSMQECSNPQAPNTCIPYLMSLVVILQRHYDMMVGKEDSPYIEEDATAVTPVENTSILSKERGKVLKLGLPWETTAADYGLQLLLTHLETGRTITEQWQTYRRNSEIVLENAKYDDLMLDMFSTEFQMRFLWGFKGSHVSPKERYSKFMQVLNVMSERCEST